MKHNNGEQTSTPISPEWIEQELKDKQLAAALIAMAGKLETGQWPQVGQSNVDELVKANKREVLIRRRDLIKERLLEIEDELDELDKTPEELEAAADTEESDELENELATEQPTPNETESPIESSDEPQVGSDIIDYIPDTSQPIPDQPIEQDDMDESVDMEEPAPAVQP